MNLVEIISTMYPADWLQGALALALFSVFVVMGVFVYLNRFTRKGYFSLWTTAWLFYAIHLAASFKLADLPDSSFLTMVNCASIGISALLMFWGSFQLTNHTRPQSELVLGSLMMIVWSYVAAYKVQDSLWITLPVFTLLAAASAYTGLLYRRGREGPQATTILTTGFLLWSLYLFCFPWLTVWTATTVIGHLVSAVLAIYIALGMVVQVLHQERDRHDNLLGEFNQKVARSRLLEQEVAVSEEKYRALFDSASDAIFLVDLETLAVLEANQSAHRLLGFPPNELVEHSFVDLCPNLRQQGRALLDHKNMVDALFRPSNEFPIVKNGGYQVTCEGDANLVPCRGRPVLQITIREITERKKMEQQLRRAEKLSAMGQLIAGVAHELNNPLAVIMGYAQILSQQGTVDEKTRNETLKIFHESERAAKIVRNLLTFARPCEPQMATVDLNRLVMSMLEVRDSEFRAANIQLRISLAAHLPKTKADPSQVEQVFANLVTNAVQALAMKDGERSLDLITEESGHYIWLTIVDTGPGIPAEVLPRIFEPFFTTKAPGKGTGLGLAICHSIMEAHHGKIWVESQVGKGTKFCLQLPILPCADEDPIVLPVIDRRAGPKSGVTRYRLMIVDDEPGIVEVLETILGGNGYLVDTAVNGNDAMAQINDGQYDLIISDMRMPEMDGETLYQTVRDKDPALARRIVFLTGDTVSASTRAFLEGTGNRWFSKPFNVSDIEEVVASLLQGEAASENVCHGPN